MKRLVTLIFILYGFSLSTLATKVDKQYRKSFSGITSISCDVPFLDIKLVGDETAKDVNVNAILLGTYKSKGRNHKEIDIKFDKSASHLSITLEGLGKSYNANFEKAEITISCPLEIEYNLNSISGNIDVINTFGKKSYINSISGDIYCKNIKGKGSLGVEATSGKIKVSDSNKKLHLNSVSGSIYCNNIDNNITAISISGRIKIQNLNGSSKLESSSGNINISEIKGNIQCSSISGKINFSNADCKSANITGVSSDVYLSNHSGDCDIESSSGRIKLTKFQGQINIETISGSIIGTELFLTGQNKLSSHSGNINMKLLNNKNNVSLDAISDFGSVQVGSSKGKHIKTSGGNITIVGYSVSGSQNYQFINNF